MVNAKRSLAKNNAGQNTQVVRKLRVAHDSGNLTATVTLVLRCLAAPDGVSEDVGRAVPLAQNASNGDDPDGQALLVF